MKRILFLDLENTLIDAWENRSICSNWRIIKNWIHSTKWDMIHVFSYAIWNNTDQLTFNNELRPWLEETFDIKFNPVILTVDMMRIICAHHLKIVMNKDDFFSFMKKEIAFRIICEDKFKGYECILLDDMVKDSILTLNDPHTVIQTFNVKRWE